jgi:hypothetical protein
VPTKYFLPMGIRADNQGMKINESNGPNATDCNAEVLQYQPRKDAREAVRPGIKRICAEWQKGVETFSGNAQRKLRLAFASSPSPALIHVNNFIDLSTDDLVFAREIEQLITLRDVEAPSGMVGRIRARRTQLTSVSDPKAFGIETAIRNYSNKL